MNDFKNLVKETVDTALKDFESRLSDTYRFGAIYYGKSIRELLATHLIAAIKKNVLSHWDTHEPTGQDCDYVDGLVKLGNVLTQSQVSDIVAYFKSKPVFNTSIARDSDGVRRSLGGPAEEYRLGGYSIDDVIAAPHLLELANSDKVIASAQEMLQGCPPTLTLLSAWWAFPLPDAPVDYLGQSFHRDPDGTANAALFTYLSDVDEEAGPHQYIKGTASRESLSNLLSDKLPIVIQEGVKAGQLIEKIDYFFQDNYHGEHLNCVYEEYLSAAMDTLILERGHGFITNTFGLHRGAVPTKEPRLIFLARYGVSDNYNGNHRSAESFQKWDWDQVSDRFSDSFNFRYVNRLLIK